MQVSIDCPILQRQGIYLRANVCGPFLALYTRRISGSTSPNALLVPIEVAPAQLHRRHGECRSIPAKP